MKREFESGERLNDTECIIHNNDKKYYLLKYKPKDSDIKFVLGNSYSITVYDENDNIIYKDFS